MGFVSQPTRIISECAAMGESRGRGKDHPLSASQHNPSSKSLVDLLNSTYMHTTSTNDGLKVGHNDRYSTNEAIDRVRHLVTDSIISNIARLSLFVTPCINTTPR